MITIQTKYGLLYQSEKLAKFPWLVHGFGTRSASLENYLTYFGNTGTIYAKTKQQHGNKVHLISSELPKEVLEGDAFITSNRDVVCFVRTADCVPILLCDPKKKVLAAVHAGWRGIACDVIGESITHMIKTFGTRANNIIAAIGPSICSACYSVGEEVIKRFRERDLPEGLWSYNDQKKAHFVDLRRAGVELLKRAEIQDDKIDFIELCTSCGQKDFISYRQDPSAEDRQVNFIFSWGD